MKPEQFCYWLQGLFEVGDPKTLTEAQCAMVKKHLQSVFEQKVMLDKPPVNIEPEKHITISRPDYHPGMIIC